MKAGSRGPKKGACGEDGAIRGLYRLAKARLLNGALYDLTRTPPCARDREFCSQLRRASLSIMNNIAEGFERHGLRDQRNMLTIAKGSAGEVRSMLHVALDVGYVDQASFQRVKSQAEEVSRLVSAWRASIDRQLGDAGILREEPSLWDDAASPFSTGVSQVLD